MKNEDAKALLKEISEAGRKRHRFYTKDECDFINKLTPTINAGENLGTSAGKELERIYRKTYGG